MSDTELAHLVDRFMRRIHAGMHVTAPKVDTDRVGPGGGMILLTLADIEPAPLQDLVRRMARDKSQITRAIQTLERKGLIGRRQTEADARVSLVYLTDKGHKTVERLRGALGEVIGGILAPLELAEKEKLTALMLRVVG